VLAVLTCWPVARHGGQADPAARDAKRLPDPPEVGFEPVNTAQNRRARRRGNRATASLKWTASDERYSPVRKSTDKEISMTNHKDVTAQPDYTPWWLTGNFIPALLVSVFLLMVYVALLGADSPQPAQTATYPAVASGQAIGYSMAAAAENGLTEADLGQPYLDWYQATHANATLNGRDEPLPIQF
jgi:hypothetical protein